MRIGYLECFAGVSGDMMLGALVDAGVSRELLEQTAASFGLGARLRIGRVDRSGISATKVDVVVNGALADAAAGEAPLHEHRHSHDHPHSHEDGHEAGEPHEVSQSHEHGHSESHQHAHSHEDEHHSHSQSHQHEHSHSHPGDHEHRHEHQQNEHGHEHGHAHGRTLPEIRALIASAAISEAAKALALMTFELLGRSESKTHEVPLETIHFHEVGAVDAIVDIVCSAVGLASLGVEQWVCSALNVGGGFVECAHGRFPVPAPATADLLRGAPTYSSGVQMEMVTPTGAALIRALDCTFRDAPAMTVETIGYGAGTRNPKRTPNVLRLSLGEGAAGHLSAGAAGERESSPFASETVAVLECSVDDMNPQVLAHCTQMALDQGALDVTATSVVMKKGRLGTMITLLCRPERAGHFEQLLFRETSTLGIRVRHEERVHLARNMVEVETPFGLVRVKVASSQGEQYHAHPEYEDCRRLAHEAGAPLKQVMDAAMRAFAESEHAIEVRR
ncbi:MAG TPA: nickel pincer cofactor biosynthesis protein LarC [Acidisarcina sp.]